LPPSSHSGKFLTKSQKEPKWKRQNLQFSSLNETHILDRNKPPLLYEMPSNSKGKNFVWKIYCFFPLNLRVLPATDSDGSTCKKWMQNALRFLVKNRSFSFFINNFWS
jgi:hypothetical protein